MSADPRSAPSCVRKSERRATRGHALTQATFGITGFQILCALDNGDFGISSRLPLPNQRPTTTYNAILFVTHETQPRMVKIAVKCHPDWGQEVHDLAPIRKICFYPLPLWIDHCHGLPLEPPGRPILAAYFSHNLLDYGSPLNECIKSASGDTAAHPWADNMLVLRKVSAVHSEFMDAVLNEDLTVLLEYWKEYGKGSDKKLHVGFLPPDLFNF
ncbi:hypothetical protein EIP91_010944 [Steccherinum ochraceum]|uniref:Uncharacterized protein n=1 Tax=Steccherinum ochraceum TaxID=92696 RepID=A0A4V2MUV6_9APHY|nr:hypothetical protein EIP91_010944 [Steccherinum ochraceum]